MGVTNSVQYQPRIPVVTATDIVPPYAVVRLVSSTSDETVGETVWTVAAPDTDDDPHVYILGNKTLTNASGDRGDAAFLPLGRVAYDPADGEPALNEEWGPKAGEFLLRKGYLGFHVAGEPDGTTAVFARVPAATMEASGVLRSVVNSVVCDALGQIVLDYTQVFGPTLPDAPTGTNVIDVVVTVDAVVAEGREVVITLGEYEYRGTTDVDGEVHFADLPGGAWVVTVVVSTGETGETKGVELPPTPAAVTLAVTT